MVADQEADTEISHLLHISGEQGNPQIHHHQEMAWVVGAMLVSCTSLMSVVTKSYLFLSFKYLLILPPPLLPLPHCFLSGCQSLTSFLASVLSDRTPCPHNRFILPKHKSERCHGSHLSGLRSRVLISAPPGHSVPFHYSLQCSTTVWFGYTYLFMQYYHVAYLWAFLYVGPLV